MAMDFTFAQQFKHFKDGVEHIFFLAFWNKLQNGNRYV